MRTNNFATRLLNTSVVLVCVLVITSCAPTRALHDALTGRQGLVPPKDPIIGPDFKLFSPDEPGWYRAPSRPHEFTIVKPGSVKGETFAFTARVLKLRPDHDKEKLIAKFRDEINNPVSARFKNTKVYVKDYPEGPGGNCLLKHWTVEDHSPAGLEGKGPMILENLDFVCIHPREKNKAAAISYSQRYFPGGRDSLLMEKASACIRNLKFSND